MFADLFTDVDRRSVPPMIVAVVMVLQRLEGKALTVQQPIDRVRRHPLSQKLVVVANMPG